MSRLDSFIRRMTAQRDILNLVSTCLDEVPGTILEFGLGSGRTFDHLRERFPGRHVIAFENDPCDHVVSRLAPLDLMLGDLRETTRDLPDGSAALVHVDLAGGSDRFDDETRGWLTPLAVRLLAPGGYLASDFALSDPRLVPQPLPSGIAPGRYHLSRRAR
jgi:trans-aconitate methyltransferase